jgi:hypothetical protein
MNEKNEILAEYSSIRDEILQLNSQAFVTITGSLTINFTILGAMFSNVERILSNNNPLQELIFLPFIGFMVLILGNILLSHKIRIAHRLALFVKYFIEEKNKNIRWSRTYFDFKEKYDKKKGKFVASITERFVEVQALILVIAQLINIVIIIYFLMNFYYKKILNLSLHNIILVALIISLIIEFSLLRMLNNYKPYKEIFKELSEEKSITQQS